MLFCFFPWQRAAKCASPSAGRAGAFRRPPRRLKYILALALLAPLHAAAAPDFRALLQQPQTVPAVATPATIVVRHYDGMEMPPDGPMAELYRMTEVTVKYLDMLNVTLIYVPPTWDVEWLLEIVRMDASVEYAYREQVREHRPTAVFPNDPHPLGLNLHNPSHDVDIDAPEAWAYTTGRNDSSSVVIAILHERALDYDDPDFAPNMWVNGGEIPNNGVDDDANGCIDDVYGCNTDSTRSNLYADPRIIGDGYDFLLHPHGLGVASVIGASGNNGIGITGVSWKVRMMILTRWNLPSLNYIVKMSARGVNIKAINLSAIYSALNFGEYRGCGSNQQTMERMTQERLFMQGIILVQGAGNDSINTDFNPRDGRGMRPKCWGIPNHIAVAAHQRNSYSLAGFSNYGMNTVDLAAPTYGSAYDTIGGIYVSFRKLFQDLGFYDPIGKDLSNEEITGFGGTSGATPHVASAIALLWNHRPDLTLTEVRSVLLDTVHRVPELSTRVASGGALNIANALYSVTTPNIRVGRVRATVAEGDGVSLEVSLAREPVRPSSGEVVVLRARIVTGSGVVEPTMLTFTSNNWHVPQTLRFVSEDDLSSNEDYVSSLEIAVVDARSTTDYRSVSPVAVPFTVTDLGSSSASLSASLGEVAEGGAFSFAIRVRGGGLGTAQATYRLSGTTRGGADYAWPADYDAAADVGTATITHGNTTRVELVLTDDALNESSEEIVMELLSVTAGGVVGVVARGANARVSVTDNDVAEVGASHAPGAETRAGPSCPAFRDCPLFVDGAQEQVLTEGAASSVATYRVTLSRASSGDVMVPWYARIYDSQNEGRTGNDEHRPDLRSATGAATTRGGVVGVVTIAAGSTQAIVRLSAPEDGLSEKQERFHLRLRAPRVGAGGGRVVLEPPGYGPYTRSRIVSRVARVVDVRAWLQGAYRRASRTMSTSLTDVLPQRQPYGGEPWHHTSPTAVAGVSAGSGLSELPQAVVDWVLVDLYSSPTAAALLSRRAALLLDDGRIVGVNEAATLPSQSLRTDDVLFDNVAHNDNDPLYVMVRHRNHLPALLAAAKCGERYCADFTGSQSYGEGQAELRNGVYALRAGDVNRDGTIDKTDERWIRRHNLTTIGPRHYTAAEAGRYAADADVDFDGEILSADRYYLFENAGASACGACMP